MFNRTDFDAWLDRQLSTREFRYFDNEGCLFGSFLNETAPPLHKFFVGGWTYARYLEKQKTEFVLPAWALELSRKLSDRSKVFTVADVRDANLRN